MAPARDGNKIKTGIEKILYQCRRPHIINSRVSISKAYRTTGRAVDDNTFSRRSFHGPPRVANAINAALSIGLTQSSGSEDRPDRHGNGARRGRGPRSVRAPFAVPENPPKPRFTRRRIIIHPLSGDGSVK